MFDSRPFKIIVMALLVLLYASLRWWNIDAACLWFDEMFSVHAAEQPWNNILDFVAADLVHPPLFYLILKIWMAIGDSDLLWLRALPFLISCLAIVPFVLLGRELKLRYEVIATALFFLSVSGILINYAQRVRMYTLLMALSLTSVWLFVRYLNSGNGLIPLMAINILALYTQYFAAFVIGCEILVILALYRDKWRAAFWLTVSSLLAFLPWAIRVLLAARSGSDPQKNIGWVARPGPAEIWTFIFDLIEPVYFQFSSDEPASIYLISLPLLLIWVGLAGVFALRFKRNEQNDKALVLMATFAFVPMVAAFAVSWVMPYSIWGARHLIVCSGPLAFLAAAMIWRIDIRYVRLAGLSAVLVLTAIAGVYQFYSTKPTYLWCRWDEIGTKIMTEDHSGDNVKVYAFESIIAYHLWFASRDSGRPEIYDVTDVEPTPEDESYFLPRGFDGVKKTSLGSISGDRVRMVFRTHKAGEELIVFETMKELGYMPCTVLPDRYRATYMYDTEFVKNGAECGG